MSQLEEEKLLEESLTRPPSQGIAKNRSPSTSPSRSHSNWNRNRHKGFCALLIIAMLTYYVFTKTFQGQFGDMMMVVKQRPKLVVVESLFGRVESTNNHSSNVPTTSEVHNPTSSIRPEEDYLTSQQKLLSNTSASNKFDEGTDNAQKNSKQDDEGIFSTTEIKIAENESSEDVEEITSSSMEDTTKITAYNSIRSKLSNSIACKIPTLDPNDISIRKITTEKFPSAKCKDEYDLIFNLKIGINESILNQIEPAEKSGWTDCCYKLVFRSNKTSDNRETFSKKCYPIKTIKNEFTIPQTHEFLAIFCNSTKNSSITDKMVDAFGLAPLKPLAEKRASRFYEESKIMAKDQVNLVVLGLDAVSHMNFQRIMPKVHKYLIHNLSAYWLDGYTKVGDNTYPNALAMLASQTVNETEASCSKFKYYDDCPFIWKKFAQRGYRTGYGEDSPWMGIFNYLRHGFKHPPTDYYLRPISRVAENNIKADKRANAHICYGPRLSFEFLLTHMKSLATRMGMDKRYFQFIWATSLTHDYVNVGRLGEELLLDFIQWMEKRQYLNNTVFVLISDHGIRWGPMRSTRQGKIEENMPFLYFVLPEKFRTKYATAVENLRLNRARLTTPFDTYATFMDILDLTNIQDKNVKKRSKVLKSNGDTLPIGISLFLPIPKSRTCEKASIPEHYCVCHITKTLPVSDKAVQQAANYAVFALNSFISKYPQCAYLSLHSVKYALLISATNNVTSSEEEENDEKTFDLSFSTVPGNATFDTTVVRNTENEWSVSGAISRTNLYGNQSYCVHNTDMKKYCYCLQ